MGIVATLRAFLGAGAVCGLLFSLADGVVAAAVGGAPPTLLSLLGCLAAAVLQYSLVAMGGLVVAGLVLHPLVRRRDPAARHLAALRLGLAIGLFAEIYWWTRPLVFYGRSAVSPERLAATAAILAVAAAAGFILASVIARAPSSAKKAAALTAAAAWLVGSVFLAFQGGAIGSRGEIGERNRDLPNVLLVIVDALRQDVLGCYGQERVKTPHIDRLAADGVVFENAFTQAPFTWTSFGSILTGKYPRRHGLLKMAPGVRMAPNVTLPLHLKNAALRGGGRLEESDWLAATFHTGTLTESSGLLQGFDLRFEATAGHGLVVLDRPWCLFRADLLLWVLVEKLEQRFVTEGTAHAARRFLARHADRRFFAMVHLYATHTPYDPSHEFAAMYCDAEYRGPIRSFWAAHREAIEQGKLDPTPADVEQIRNLYGACVSQADREVGDLLVELERQGIRDDTLVVLTSDHGESLGEGGLWEHNHMTQTNLRVPLVLSWPKGLPKGKRVSAITDEIDVFPTVCDLLGLELPPSSPADELDRARVDGASLLPLVRGERDAVRLFSFAENGVYLSVQDHRRKLVVLRETLTEPEGWKQAREGKPEWPRLFDLEGDREERFNRFQREPEEADRLFAALRDWNDKLPIPVHDVVLSPREIESMRNLFKGLGYTEGGIGADEPDK